MKRAAAPRTLLIVEDDAAVPSTAELLRAAGYSVLSAPDGAAARRRLEDAPAPPALIVVDALAGGIAELMTALDGARGAPRVLLLTELSHVSRAPAATAVITRPVRQRTLLAVVARLSGAVVAAAPRRARGGKETPVIRKRRREALEVDRTQRAKHA